MLFPTFSFFFFFALVFLLYWYVFRIEKQRKVFLLVASYIFYASWDVRFCLLLFTATLINYLFGLILSREKEHNVRVVVISIITFLNVIYLFCFKYLYDVISALAYIFPSVFDASLILPQISSSSLFLPVGISYYTFKCMSYTFDIYNCKLRIGKNNFVDTLLYVAFFPQLLSGPIVNASYFFRQLKQSLNRDKASYKAIQLDKAMLLLMAGLFKKLILASFLSILICDKVFAMPSAYNTVELFLAMLSFTVVIYADFSGYSDIAIAIALLLGFETPPNFNRPYFSTSISEFWRRWHISFSTWLKDYVYFPLGGSRYSIVRTSFALLATMSIAGLWHGMRLNFLLWGLLQGLMLSIEKMIKEKTKPARIDLIGKNEKTEQKKGLLYCFTIFCRLIFVFLFINISWLIFKSESLNDLGIYLASFLNFRLPSTIITPLILFLIGVGFFMQLPTNAIRKKLILAYSYVPLAIKMLIFSTFIIAIHLVSTSSMPAFIYFAF